MGDVTITEDGEIVQGGLSEGIEQSTSLAVSLARAEIDQQIATSRALPRSIQKAVSNIMTLATLDEETAAECIYALPRGGKTIRGPSIRFAEIMASQWGNCRIGARVVHVDKVERYVEAEGVFHDLETNVAQTARIRRTIQAKRGKGIDADMIQLAGAAACSIARRNAILAGIPKGVARKGYLAVENVIRGDVKTLVQRRDAAIKAFAHYDVTPDKVFSALGVSGLDDITLDHLATLTGMRSAIKNGESTVEEMFGKPEPDHKVVANPLADEPEATNATKEPAADGEGHAATEAAGEDGGAVKASHVSGESSPAATGAGSGESASAATAGPAVSEWFAIGAKAARDGMSRRGLPPELRTADRADDADAWFTGFDSVKNGGAK